MKVVIIGASGQLGSDIKLQLERNHDVVPFDHYQISVENYYETKKILSVHSPDFIINTAAFHNVELCESDPQQAFLINSTACKGLSKIANELNSVLIHFSTNYVFGGDNRTDPYLESDKPYPVNMYGISKLAGEYLIKENCNKWYIFRVAGLFGKQGTKAKKYKNFVDMMIKLGRKNIELPSNNEEIFTFTSTADLAKMTEHVIPKDKFGMYHATNSGECSRFTFTNEIFKILDIECKLTRVGISYFKAKYKQPQYTVLDNKKLKKLGFTMPEWQLSLKEYLLSSYKSQLTN